MAKQTINIGVIQNDGTGTPLRDAGDIINDNFNEIYTTLGDGTNLTSNYITASSSDTLTNKTLGDTQINGDLTFYSDDGGTLAGTIANNFGRLEFYNEEGTRFIYFENTQHNIQVGADLVVSSAKKVVTNKIEQGSGSSGNIEITSGGAGSVIIESGTNNEINVTNGLVDITGDLTLSGDLTVNGTTTTVNSTNTTITDNLIELNSGAASNANDTGILIERGSTGDNAIMAWDESADKFIFGTTTATASDTGDLTITSGTIVASTFEGNLTGDVTGNADTATTLATARTIAGQSFDGSANISIASTDLSDTASIALLDSTQTLTNKTIAAGSNTISGLTSSNLNSAVRLDILDSAGTIVKTLFGSGT